MKNITVVGTDAERELVDRALERASIDLDAKLRAPYAIEFHAAAEFRARGFAIDGETEAWGYGVKRTFWVNSTFAQSRPKAAEYVVAYGLGLAIDRDYNDAAKRAELKALMPSVAPNQHWSQGQHRHRPAVIFADAFADAVGVSSPLTGYFGGVTDPAKLLEITFR